MPERFSPCGPAKPTAAPVRRCTVSASAMATHSAPSRVRSFIKKVETAIASGDKAAAAEALRTAQPELQRAANRGVTHKNTVARKLSRLSAHVKALTAQ